MNGAESLVRSLIASGMEVCFANPGTSEMHFVAALDKVSGMRCVLGLHETVVTGAADGYARMAGKSAITLLHTGPGLANGLSNLHNARKAHTSVVNIVGEHALSHIQFDAPLTSDIQSIAAPMSHWVETPQEASALASAGAEAVRQAHQHPGQIATLILPANTAWDAIEGDPSDHGDAQDADNRATSTKPFAKVSARPTGHIVKPQGIIGLAEILKKAANKKEAICFILGGHCLLAQGLELADKLAQNCDASVLAETFKSRFQRGAGRVTVEEVPYAVDAAVKVLAPFKHIVLVCAKAPVGFFAYPDKPSKLYPEHAQIHELAAMSDDGLQALSSLVEAMDAQAESPRLQIQQGLEEPADEPLNIDAVGVLLTNQLPENAVVIDEAVTSGAPVFRHTRSAAAHDWLEVCGGSIGGGMPLATGAAVACPDRIVINLQADGSGMYSLQALWTQAREQLNIVTIIFANSSYAILKLELDNVQAASGQVAMDMMELDRPVLDWVSMARGMGVNAHRAATVNEFRSALKEAFSPDSTGPCLIEAVLP